MKTIAWLIAFLIGVQMTYAQSWEEWFRQRKTQIKYLLQQIAVLQAHIGYLKKGYEIAKNATDLIQDIKQGDIHLHDTYFNSLKTVSTDIRHYSKVAAVISDESIIQKRLLELNHYCEESDQLSFSEKAYVRSIQAHLYSVCEQHLAELFLVITSGELEMKSNERIQKLDRLYASMKDKLSFVGSLSKQVQVLVIQRKMELADTEKLKKYWGK